MVNAARACGSTCSGGGGRDGGGEGATSAARIAAAAAGMTPAAQADGDGADPSADASGGLSGA